MKRALLTLLLVIVIVFGGGALYYAVNSTAVSSDTTERSFVVNQGDGLSLISARLQANGLVKSRYVFMILAYQLGLNTRLQAGTFHLSASLTPEELAQKLSKGGSHDYWFKIAEGARVEEIANSLPSDMSLTSAGFIIGARSLEGHLYPDSYLIPEGYNLNQILDLVKKNFDQKIATAALDSTNTDMTPDQIVTFASLLEREGRSLDSKQHIAGVLLNRLSLGMALQVDASVQYARDSKTLNSAKKEYWKPVTKNDLDIVSAYNTYKNVGLTPLPICNPGYNALYAAYHPFKSDYLFYITGNDGQMHYAKTLAEHNANIAKYLK